MLVKVNLLVEEDIKRNELFQWHYVNKIQQAGGCLHMVDKINLLAEANKVYQLYVYEKVGRMNGHTLSVVNVENRTLDFHVHEESNELFYVIEGSFQLETEDGLT